MVMGRPTKYNETTLEVANNYLHNYRSFGDEFPSRVGLALVLGVNPDTIYEWAKHPDKFEFSEMLAQIKAKQRQVLLNNGINGSFNSNISKLVLAQHGFVSKSESDVNLGIKLESWLDTVDE